MRIFSRYPAKQRPRVCRTESVLLGKCAARSGTPKIVDYSPHYNATTLLSKAITVTMDIRNHERA